jgi:hypothetical protein
MPSKSKKRYKVRPGTHVPGAENAGIDLYKLTKYALNADGPTQEGRGKAKGFRELLGITLDDRRYLHDQLLERLPTAEATHVCLDDPSFIEFSVPILVDGLNGQSRVVQTGWGVDGRDEPWLTTLYATKRTAL